MRRHGLTLLEMLAVVAIASALTAILTPVFASAKRQAQVSSSLGILHQLHVATVLYQQEYDGGGALYGDLDQMGLPNALVHSSLAAVSPTKSIDLPSPCGLNPLWASDGKQVLFQYVYRPGGGGPTFAKQIGEQGDRYVLFYDVNCDDSNAPLYNRTFSHRALGVTLGGDAFIRRRVGFVHSDAFWAP